MNFVFDAFFKAPLFSQTCCCVNTFINPKQLQVCFFLLSSLSLRLTQPITTAHFHTVSKSLGSFSLIFSFTLFARGGFCVTDQKDRKRSQALKATDEIWWRISVVVPSRYLRGRRLATSLQPLEGHVRRWQRVRHHETDHHPRIPQLQLHKLPQVLTNARAVKHKQDDMIKTMWLPVNIEQKLLQYF